MNCNCINRVQEMLREKLGDPNAEMNGMYIFNEETHQMEFRPSITILYYKKKKDGTFNKETRRNAAFLWVLPILWQINHSIYLAI